MYKGVLNSYAQLFFAINPLLGFVALLVSFGNGEWGLCGLCSVVFVQLLALWTSQDKSFLGEGMFGFNALLLGLAMANRYEINAPWLLLQGSGLILLMGLTVWWNHALGKYRLPYLTFPFLLTYWVLTAGAGSMSLITLRYPALLSEVSFLSGLEATLAWPQPVVSFFKTLGSIYFQNTLGAGLLLAFALLIHSRISLVLAVLSYSWTYVIFGWVGASTVHLSDYLVGSNFIFMAIALGGFYVVPSRVSFGLVVLLTPLLMVMMFAWQGWLAPLNLPPFTLAFSIITVVILFFLQISPRIRGLIPVQIQYYSPEKTLYKSQVQALRLAHQYKTRLQLPVWGQWSISQGYQGSHTHLGLWSNALDFVIRDQDGLTHKGDGSLLEDFYCYNKPVIAPQDGYIVALTNHVAENSAGGMDLEQNWGNSLVIHHLNGLYTQLSHLRKDSFQVAMGQWVTKGQILAACGNSGRSPEPHLHFQVQSSPEIGAPTLDYPLAHYLATRPRFQNPSFGPQESALAWRQWSVPQEGEEVKNPEPLEWLSKAMAFKPGQTLRLQEEGKPEHILDWKVYTDANNRTYLHCSRSKSSLWFVHDGVMFWAYDFEGQRDSVLHAFYLSVYRLSLCAFAGTLEDRLPLTEFSRPLPRWIQDLLAPWWIFYSVRYESRLHYTDSTGRLEGGVYRVSVRSLWAWKVVREVDFRLQADATSGLNRFVMEGQKAFGLSLRPVPTKSRVFRCVLR
jgi:urea transporter/murein DD-endopeptidase MepM/ murein hydrolase activator NlpD